jgi:hypothetical protein
VEDFTRIERQVLRRVFIAKRASHFSSMKSNQKCSPPKPPRRKKRGQIAVGPEAGPTALALNPPPCGFSPIRPRFFLGLGRGMGLVRTDVLAELIIKIIRIELFQFVLANG